MAQTMKTSVGGRRLIRMFEGDKLVAYRDCVGVWTVGTGHTAAAGQPIPHPGLCISQAESDATLARDLVATERAVLKALKRQPTQAQFDAMVSLAFNIGAGGFARSSVVSRFNRGDNAGAAAAFLSWNKAGGRVVDGLTRRRAAEMKLFRTGDQDAAQQKFGLLADPVDMPSAVDAPAPPKTMATSKAGWASIATGVSGVGGFIAAAQPMLDNAQQAKAFAGQAVDLFGVDGRLALLAGLTLVIVFGCAFLWADRRSKLVHDGV